MTSRPSLVLVFGVQPLERTGIQSRKGVDHASRRCGKECRGWPVGWSLPRHWPEQTLLYQIVEEYSPRIRRHEAGYYLAMFSAIQADGLGP